MDWREVVFFGNILSKDGIQADPNEIESVKNFA